jgi:long-chain acyl-CoA synthetase
VHASLVHLVDASCKKFSSRDLFGTKTPSGFSWITYAEFRERIQECTSGLAALGVGPGDRVAIIADNCVEWATAAYATYARGATFIPMYTAQLASEWRFILKDSLPSVVIAGTAKVYGEIKNILAEGELQFHCLGIHLPKADAASFEQLRALGREKPAEWVFPTADSIAGLIYTTGTTGDPKGVMLSHRNLSSNCSQIAEAIPLPPMRSLAFLPWAHVFGQTGELHYFIHEGHSMALNNDVAELIPNLAVVKPTILVAVPRIFNRIYEGINRQMLDKPAPIRKLFAVGVASSVRKKRGETLSLLETLALTLADRLIFSKARARFGGNLQLVISGSAALNPKVAEFVDALGINLYEGYGLTETSPVVSVNTPKYNKLGTVGRALPGVRVSIDETQSENPGEGEVVVHGDNVMVGYYNRPEQTAATKTEDGGLRTGDLGRVDSNGFLTITGRLKELYKLETGKYVAPVSIEEALKVSPLFTNAVVYGANKPHNVAVVVANREAIERWATESGVTLGNLRTDHRVRELLQEEVIRVTQDCKSFERPKAIVVTDEDFTTENGLLTPKLSVKRREVIKRYQTELDALYVSK